VGGLKDFCAYEDLLMFFDFQFLPQRPATGDIDNCQSDLFVLPPAEHRQATHTDVEQHGVSDFGECDLPGQ
jgi:hypothetical protein